VSKPSPSAWLSSILSSTPIARSRLSVEAWPYLKTASCRGDPLSHGYMRGRGERGRHESPGTDNLQAPYVTYSYLRAIKGSTFAARRAGM